MGLFSFGKKKARTIALIDIGSASVGGAYVHYVEGAQPIIYYTARVDVEPRPEEDIRDSMLRSLSFLERLLVEEGAPQLHRETGSGAVEKVVVSIASPWQQTAVTTTKMQERKPFTFTHAHLEQAAQRSGAVGKDHVRSGHTVIATILNGYETANPFGKRVTRAELVILTSALEREAARGIQNSLHKAFHTSNIELTAFAPAAYTVFRDLYPHQKDFIVLDVSGTGTDIAFVKHGLLTDVKNVPYGIHDLLSSAGKAGARAHLGADSIVDQGANQVFQKESEIIEHVWFKGLNDAFSAFAADQALPRTVFLLADTDARDYLKRTLETSTLRTLWLSDEPLSIISVLPANLAPKVKTRGLGEGDLFLAMLALFAGKQPEETGPST